VVAHRRLLALANPRHTPPDGIFRQHHPRPAALRANFAHRHRHRITSLAQPDLRRTATPALEMWITGSGLTISPSFPNQSTRAVV